MTRLAIVVTAVLAAAPALAQTKVEEARQHFKRGTELYDEGNYRGALVEFQRAYDLSPNYKLLYNMGQVYLELQDYAKAGRNLNRYLTEGGNEVPAARRDEVTKQLERLKNRVGNIVVDTAAGAEILVDDESQGYAPLPEPMTVSIGRHKVTVIIPGSSPQSRVVDVAGLQTLTVAFSGGDSGGNGIGVAGRAGGGGKTRPLVIGLWVGTGVLAVTAAVMAFVAFGASNTLKDQRSHIQTSPDTLQAQAGAVFGDSIAADILTALAVVAGVSALVVTLTGGSDSSAPHVSVGLGPHGFALTGNF
jgi:hypothetical protein